jgi:hypothetical protein
MKSDFAILAAMTAALGLASACPARSEDIASQIVGVWKYVSLNNKEVASGKTAYPLGEKPNGYMVYTKSFSEIAIRTGQGAAIAERRIPDWIPDSPVYKRCYIAEAQVRRAVYPIK